MLIPHFKDTPVDLPAVPHRAKRSTADASPGRLDSSGGIGIRELIQGIRHHIVLIGFAAILTGFVGWGTGVLLPPTYKAEGLLVIDTQQFNMPELQSMRSVRTVEPWGARSEALILTSPDLIRQTIADLALTYDPSFNATLRDGPLARLTQVPFLPNFVKTAIAERRNEPVVGPAIVPELVEDISQDLNVFSEERSYAISVSFTGRDPHSAALLVNGLMQRYLANEIEAIRGPSLRAQADLQERVDKLFADLERTRGEIRRLETQGDLLTTGTDTLQAQELAEIATERRQLANLRLGIEAELEQLRASLTAGQYSVPNTERETPRLRTLWEIEGDLRNRLAEREVELGANHPIIQTLRQELADNQSRIAGEVRQIGLSIERELAAFDNRDQLLADRIDAARGSAAISAEGRTVLGQLRTEEISKQKLYDDYRERYEQTVASQGLFAADARIVSEASPPIKPSSPSPLLLAIAGLMLGTIGATGWVIGRHYLGDGVETMADAGQVSGLPALGGIPRVGGLWQGDTVVADHVATNPKSAITETVRGILFRLTHPEAGAVPPKVIMVTSPMPRDGKSSLVTSIARVAARDGVRVLAIDCDFRKPSLAGTLGVTPRWWLNDFLDDSLALGDTLIQDPRGTAHFLLSKPVANCSRAFLEQTALQRLVTEAREFYDLILIDSPPVMKVVDPLILSQLADVTVMVVSWREVSRQVIREAIERLDATSTPIIGFVLSRVGGKVPENYVYGGYGTPDS